MEYRASSATLWLAALGWARACVNTASSLASSELSCTAIFSGYWSNNSLTCTQRQQGKVSSRGEGDVARGEVGSYHANVERTEVRIPKQPVGHQLDDLAPRTIHAHTQTRTDTHRHTHMHSWMRGEVFVDLFGAKLCSNHEPSS